MSNNVGCVCVAIHIRFPKVAPFFWGVEKESNLSKKKKKILKYDL